MKIQVVQLKDKNLELMLATSVVSDSLINLFYLDGSTKTIGIDETTTISELANLACSFMSIALFEVVQNIQSASQYKMLLPNQNVVTLIDQWEKAGQPYIKIVMPINNPTNISLNNYNNNLYPEDAFNSRESFASMSPHAHAGRESVMNRSSMLVTSPMALLPSNFTSPSPGKSIYKIKQSSVGTTPVFMSSSADLMATSLESRTGSLPPSVPPSPGRRNTNNANNNSSTAATTTATTNSHFHLTNPPSTPGGPKDDNSSRNSSISEAPSGTDGGTLKSHSNSQIVHMRDPAAMLVASQVQVHALQAEMAELKAQLKKAEQKYDVLQAVCFKSGQLDYVKLQSIDTILQQQSMPPNASNANTSTNTSSAMNSSPTHANTALLTSTTTSVGSGVPVEQRKVSKRSSFSWGSKSHSPTPSSTSTHSASMQNLRALNSVDEDNASEKELAQERSTFSLSRTNKPVAVRSSISTRANKGSETSGNRVRTSTAGTLDTENQSERPPSRNNNSNSATPNKEQDMVSETEVSVAQMSMNGGNSTITQKIHQETKSLQIVNDVLQDPTKILSLNRSALNLLVRTFFVKVGEIEGFCNKYCRLFDSVLHTDIISANNHSNSTYNWDDDGAPLDSALYNEDGSDPKLITHIYHMIAAMDGVYEFLVEYHEDWRVGLRTWLLRTFDECVQLPVVRTDDLKSTIYCLQRENLILSPEVLDIIQGSIDTSMHNKTTHVTNYRFKYTNNTSGSDSYGASANGSSDVRGTDSVYTVVSGAANYNSTVYMQTMDNIITTYYSVIGDLLPTLPVEIDVFAVFQMKLTNIMKNYIKATFYTHKQLLQAPELIKLVSFYDKLAAFCDKFLKTTSPVVIKNVTEMRPDVLRQCNTALVASLAEQMLKLFNQDEPAMSAEVDLSEKRTSNSPDLFNMMSGSNNNTNSSGGVAHSTSNSNLNEMEDIEITGIFRCSTQWPIRLVCLLREHLGWIPSETDTQKKVYWCILLLDTLQEFHVKQTNWLTQSLKANTMTVGPLCKYVNNHTKFALLLNDCIDEWAAELSDRHAVALFDKCEYTVNLFVENSSTGVEGIAQLLYAEVKDILKSSLFRSGWDDSIKCVLLLKSTLHRHFTFLQQHLCSGVGSAGDGGTGGLEAVQQLLIYICECIVSLYIEMLLTNTSITMNLNTISRLSEDVELLTKLFDELRNKIYLSRMQLGARAPHIIATPVAEAPNKRRMLNFGVNPKLGKNKTAVSKAGATTATAKPGAAVVASVPTNTNQTEEERLSTTLLAMEEETKTTFRVILQPLSHLVLA
eukprot:gene12688-14661_t